MSEILVEQVMETMAVVLYERKSGREVVVSTMLMVQCRRQGPRLTASFPER